MPLPPHLQLSCHGARRLTAVLQLLCSGQHARGLTVNAVLLQLLQNESLLLGSNHRVWIECSKRVEWRWGFAPTETTPLMGVCEGAHEVLRGDVLLLDRSPWARLGGQVLLLLQLLVGHLLLNFCWLSIFAGLLLLLFGSSIRRVLFTAVLFLSHFFSKSNTHCNTALSQTNELQ